MRLRPKRPSPVDDANFQAFYRSHAEHLTVFFARRTLDAETAVDLMAEAFAQAFIARDTFRGSTDEDAKAWLFGIARNLLSGYWRTGASEQRALNRLAMEAPVASVGDIERIEELAGTAELRQAAANGMKALSNSERDAVRLRVVDDLSYEEVAAQLSITEDAARARVSRGLRNLAGHLETAAAGKESS